LAAAALIFGSLFCSCSDSGGGDNDNDVNIVGVWEVTMGEGAVPFNVYVDADTVYRATKGDDDVYVYSKETASIFGTYTVSGSTVKMQVAQPNNQEVSGEVNGNTITINAEGAIPQITLAKVDGAKATYSDDNSTTQVDAVWNFTTLTADSTLSASTAEITNTEPKSNVNNGTVTVDSGEGATLSVSGRWKTAAGYIQANKSSNNSGTSATNVLTLTLAGNANVTIVCCGAGGQESIRTVVLAKDTTPVSEAANLSNLASSEDKTIEATLNAGEYKIYANGARIKSITCASN
ncbi:MAG: hypothetical protein NC219_01650, partial [Prevotella sp.]|nr:hypothetical protein [Prevotella sp.]